MTDVTVGVSHRDAEAEPVIMAARAYWRSVNGGRVPVKKTFDLMNVYRQAPHLLMAERIGPAEFKFVYCGTLVAENFPLDLTGKSYGPDTPRVSKVPWPQFFSTTLDGPCLRFGEMPIDWPGPKFAYARYGTFPLADDAGVPRFALACLVFGGKR